MANAHALVRRVAGEGHRELLLRVVAEAEGISADTVSAALAIEQGGDKWKQRKQVLDELPGLVPDPAAVVALLVRFVAGTTHGADLFWAREHLRAIGEGTFSGGAVPDEVARQARDEAGRVLDEKGDPEAWGVAVRDMEATLKGVHPDRDGIWRPVPAGSFRMGSTKATDPGRRERKGPQHVVHLTPGFRMLAVPVTNHLYECFDPGHDRRFGTDAADHPVVNVTWYEATMFAEWVSRVLGEPCRLPTETEWEHACRGTTSLEAPSTRFWSGPEDADLYAAGWVAKNSGYDTHAVDDLPSPRGREHPHGLLHLHGNVDEWCADWLDHFASDERQHDPEAVVLDRNPTAGRAFRGGGWVYVPRLARSAFRNGIQPSNRDDDRGFRLVLPGPFPPSR